MKTHLRISSALIVAIASIFSPLWNLAQGAVTIIDFEQPNFLGVRFSSDFDTYLLPLPQRTYMRHSGDRALRSNLITEGYKECTFTFTTPGRRFLGAWIYVYSDNVQFVLYRDGGIVGRSSVISNTPTSTFLSSSYDGPVDSVGVLGNRGYYVLDDLTYADDPQNVCTPHAAAAITHISGGSVTSVSLTDAGCGYTNAPLVLIQGGGGSGAAATAAVVGGQVTSITIVNSGCCYTNSPRIVIAAPPFVPKLTISVSRVRVSQSVALGRRYVLDSSTNLINWNVTGPSFTAESEMIDREFDVGLTGRFFRLREVP